MRIPIIKYGIVVDGIFYSDMIMISVNGSNGIYSIDLNSIEYTKTLQLADIFEFKKAIKKSKYMEIINGYTFKNSFIPDNIIKYKSKYKIPIPVTDIAVDDWSYISVLYNHARNLFYFIEPQFNSRFIILNDLRNKIDNDISITGTSQMTPEMRILCSLHILHKQSLAGAGIKKSLDYMIKSLGVNVISITEKNNNTYNIIWEFDGVKIDTIINKDFSVVEAGFCVGGNDKLHSINSLILTAKDYDSKELYTTRF